MALHDRPAAASKARAQPLLLIILALYTSFPVLEYALPGHFRFTNALRFCSVCLCLVLAMVCHRDTLHESNARLLLLALACTVTADLFLLLTDWFTAGILVFCLAHLAHIRRFGGKLTLYACLAAGGFLGTLVLALWVPNVPSILPAATTYAILIVSSVIHAIRSTMHGIQMARAGMVLFLLCDVCVLLFNLLPFGHALHRGLVVLIWVFYLPSQVLLAVSGS